MSIKGKVTIEFEGYNCLNCPFCRYSELYNDYSCIVPSSKGEKYRVIQHHVEYPNELGSRPDWCPIEEESNMKPIPSQMATIAATANRFNQKEFNKVMDKVWEEIAYRSEHAYYGGEYLFSSDEEEYILPVIEILIMYGYTVDRDLDNHINIYWRTK